MKRTVGILLVAVVLLVMVSTELFATAGTALKYTPLIPNKVTAAAETTMTWVLSDSLDRYIKVPPNCKDMTVWMYANTLNADSLVGLIRVSPEPGAFGQVIDSLSITASAGSDFREYGDTSTYWGLAKYVQLVAKTQDQHTAAAVVYNTYCGGIIFFDGNGQVIERKFVKIYESFNRKDNND